jgi:hypothetical protein
VSASVANALDVNPANNTATLALNGPPPATADVQVTLAATSATLLVGEATALTATVVDAGPGTAMATSLTLSVPAGFALDGVDAGVASCTGTGPVSCALGDLAAGAPAQVTLRLHATALGLTSASASVGTAVGDPDLTNNAATLSLIVAIGGDSDGDRIRTRVKACSGSSSEWTMPRAMPTATASPISRSAWPARTRAASSRLLRRRRVRRQLLRFDVHGGQQSDASAAARPSASCPKPGRRSHGR